MPIDYKRLNLALLRKFTQINSRKCLDAEKVRRGGGKDLQLQGQAGRRLDCHVPKMWNNLDTGLIDRDIVKLSKKGNE